MSCSCNYEFGVSARMRELQSTGKAIKKKLSMKRQNYFFRNRKEL